MGSDGSSSSGFDIDAILNHHQSRVVTANRHLAAGFASFYRQLISSRTPKRLAAQLTLIYAEHAFHGMTHDLSER